MIPAIYVVNSYLWKLLQDQLDWTTDDYNGKIPIMPAAEAVEFDEFDKPFIIYGWSLEGAPSDLYVMNAENAGYSVYSDSTTIIDTVLNLLNNVFRSKDDAARNINRWMNSTNNPAQSAFAGSGINFTSLEMVSLSGPTPPGSEGGKSTGFVVVRYEYTLTVDPADYLYV